MANFDFIIDDALRTTLVSDYDEMRNCMGAQAWKAAQALAGGVIEAILLDYLLSTDYQSRTGKDPSKLELGPLIMTCHQEHIVSERVEKLSDVVRDYRNLIHPGKVRRDNEQVSRSTAQVAQALVDIIIEEVGAKRRSTYGLTAAQVVYKIEHDNSALSILSHLLADMKQPVEWERLLLDVLPATYFLQLAQLPHWTEPREPTDDELAISKTMGVLENCFRQAFSMAPQTLRERVARNFVKIVREETEPNVLAYEKSLWRCSDLDYLAEDQRSLVKQHLLARFMEGTDSLELVLRLTRGMGRYLTDQETVAYGTILIKCIARLVAGRRSLTNLEVAAIADEFFAMSAAAQQKFVDAVEYRIESLRQTNHQALLSALLQLREFWVGPPIESPGDDYDGEAEDGV